GTSTSADAASPPRASMTGATSSASARPSDRAWPNFSACRKSSSGGAYSKGAITRATCHAEASRGQRGTGRGSAQTGHGRGIDGRSARQPAQKPAAVAPAHDGQRSARQARASAAANREATLKLTPQDRVQILPASRE